jgi:hypothetical protein
MINRLLKSSTLVMACIVLGCLPVCGEDKIVDVNMPSPFVPLPLYIDSGTPCPYVADGRVKQDSGPEAEVMTAYRTPDKNWPVWARLPDQTGEFVFSKGDEKVKVTVSDDEGQPYAHRIVVQSVKGGTAAKADQSMLKQRAVLLSIPGPVKQISGPTTALLTGKAGTVWAKIPEQVCTLIFETEGKTDRTVIRVWADKDNRCFVSGKNGNDTNPGTEEKPFKTMQRAVKHVREKPEKRGGIYVSGGDYDLGDEILTVDYQVSLFGGFNESGWRRDSIITAPVLLPNGFCENWIDDITDRQKDLRRAEPRYNETVIFRRTKLKLDTVRIGDFHAPGHVQAAGSPDTYIDGVTVYGPDEKNATDANTSLDAGNRNRRTIRNCMFVQFYGGGHCRIMGACGDGRFENNIVQSGVISSTDNSRPQIVGTFGRWHRNLVVGPSGGSYTRILNLWGEGGTFTENQVHGGESTGWTGMQAHHGNMHAERVNTFRKNVLYLDYLFNPFWGKGLVIEDNEIYLFKGGATELMASKALTIQNNHFHLAPGVKQELLWPKKLTHKLGGKFDANEKTHEYKYIEPEGEGTGRPTIENNKFAIMEKADRRKGDLVDLKRLIGQVEKVGESAWVRPKDPAKNLKAQMTGKGTVTLAWEESADADVAGYLVRYGQKSNSYQNPTFLGKVKLTDIKNLQPGTWYFTIVPIKEGNVECWKLSNEVQVVVE